MSAVAASYEAVACFDAPQVRTHVELLHERAAGVPGKFVVSVFFAVGGEGTITHHGVGDTEGMIDAIMAHDGVPGANVYCGLHLMRTDLPRKSRGSRCDIVAVLGLVADMDADTGKSGAMPVNPSYVVETSPGNNQPAILFSRSLTPDQAIPLAKALQAATGGDSGTGDIVHVWRIPGTLNYPNAAKLGRGRNSEPALVRYSGPFVGEVHDASVLAAALAPFAATQPAAAHESFKEAVETGPLLARLSEKARELLTGDGQPDRSRHAARVIEQLAHESFSLEETASMCLERLGAWTDKFPSRERLIEDIQRNWNKFGAPKVAARISNAEAVERVIGTAANENQLQAAYIPPMHPTPFTPEAAGGLLKDVAEWITGTAIVPVPELSLAAAIAMLAGMFGDRALAPTRTGLNLFLTTVMGVASGKGHPPKRIIELASLAGKPGAVSNGDPTSYAAIERMLRQNPSTVLVMDEFGITLQEVNARQTNSAAATIRKFLLSIYDQADSMFYGRQYASAEAKKDDSPIDGPALTVLGMTTATTLYAGLSEASLNSGFLSRFVFVAGSHPERIKAPSLSRRGQAPAELVERLKKAALNFPKAAGGNLAFMKKIALPFDGGEEGPAYRRWAEVFEWQHWQGWSERETQINGRAAENTIRLASIRAVSRNPACPAVTAADVEWGWGIVHGSIVLMTDGVNRHMVSSPAEALRKAIVAALETAQDKTLAWSHILKREGVSQADLKEVSEALRWLCETGTVKNLSSDKPPGARMRFQLAS